MIKIRQRRIKEARKTAQFEVVKKGAVFQTELTAGDISGEVTSAGV
jgi:hypothetical protein